MKWIKKGLIYGPDGSSNWAKHSALQPTAVMLNENVIRVYAGFRDDLGRGRVGYVDLDSVDPSKVLQISEHPVLDIGNPGTFDSNGIVPTCVLRHKNKILLFYAGYQIPNDVRFLVFGGLAVSNDNGESFERVSNVPIMDRTNDELLFRVPHSVIFENGVWKIWYGGGGFFIDGKKKTLPVYDIRYVESSSLDSIPKKGQICLTMNDDEHRLGRPFVFKESGIYKMFFGYGSESIPYRLSYAESVDGLHWARKDEDLGLTLSRSGWDSEMMAYPCIIKTIQSTFLFYNGNEYGRKGFGYAILDE